MDRRQRRHRRAHPEVHAGRQVHRAVRQAAPQSQLGSNDTENFGRVAKIFVDPKANEAYIADGYGNKRVAVIDADTGKIKRYWGAYGNKPDDTQPRRRTIRTRRRSQQFRTPVHCAELSNDGLVYVCDRPNDRIQVFTKDGQVRQGSVRREEDARRRLRRGTSRSRRIPQQKYIYPRRRQERAGLHHAARDARDPLDASATAAGSPASSSPSTASRPTRRATSSRPRPTRAGACRSSCTRAWRRCRATRARPGRPSETNDAIAEVLHYSRSTALPFRYRLLT